MDAQRRVREQATYRLCRGHWRTRIRRPTRARRLGRRYPHTTCERHRVRRRRAPPWVWRCHIDTATAYAPSWNLLRPYIEEHDAAIFTMPQFVRPDLTIGRVLIQAPSIDPLSVKNLPMPPDEARRIVAS